MRLTLKHLTAICSAAMLLACADTVQRVPAALAAVNAAHAAEAYAIARSQHMAQRFDEAAVSYHAALQAMPGHVNAQNGLAALRAEQGDYAAAIALWQAMTGAEAEKAGAANAYLFGNLGYAYHLKGDYAAAQAALEKACMLDPLNHRAWQHLGATLAKRGQHQRAAQMARQAATLRSHDLMADYAMVDRARLAALDFAVRPAGQDGVQWDQTEVREAEPGVFVLRRVKAAQAQEAAALFELPGAPLENRITIGADGMATLEIRNGNGVNGAAKALAGTVGEAGLRVVRLTNHKGYGVRHSRVEYRLAYRAAAERLAELVGAKRVVKVEMKGRADLRLVIGRDLRPEKAAAAAAPALASRPKEAAKAS